jgi:hypothetical protein
MIWTAQLGLISCTFMLWCSVMGLNVSEGCCRSCSPRHQVITLLHVRSRHQVIALLHVRYRSQADVQRIPETVHRHLARLIRCSFWVSRLVHIVLVASARLVLILDRRPANPWPCSLSSYTPDSLSLLSFFFGLLGGWYTSLSSLLPS